MNRSRPLLPASVLATLTVALLGIASSSSAQTFNGTFSAMGRYGLVELVLRQEGSSLNGTLTGNDLSFDLTGEVAADDPGFAYGSIAAPDIEQAFEAYVEGQHLELYVIGLLPDGELDWNNVSLLEFDLAGKTTPDPAPTATTPVPPAVAGGSPLAATTPNPLTGNDNPLTRNDPYTGIWSDGQLELDLHADGAGFGGWLTFRGARYPVKASESAEGLSGTFEAGGVAYPFTAALVDGRLALDSDGARYQLLPIDAPAASPSVPASAPGATIPADQDAAPADASAADRVSPDASDTLPSAPDASAPAAQTATASEVVASGAYGQLTRDGAYAFIEALQFVLAELGETQALAGVSDEEIVEALAAGFPALDPESQQSLANAREIWEQTRQSWAYTDLTAKKEFAYAVLTIAYGENAANSALGIGGGQGGGGGPIGMPSPDPHIQEQTNKVTGCWAAAGCDGYDPIGDDFTYDTPDGY